MTSRALLLLCTCAGFSTARAQAVEWQPTGGPAAHVYALASYGDTVLALADTLYATSDRGATWVPLGGAGLPEWGATLMRTRAGDLVVGHDSLYRSSDGGTSWTATAFPFEHPDAHQAEHITALFEDAGGSLLAGTYWSDGMALYGHIYRFDTAGWSLAAEPPHRGPVRDFTQALGGQILAARAAGFEGGAQGLYRSPDGASSWDRRWDGYATSLATLHDGGLLALVQGVAGMEVVRSVDDGWSWMTAGTVGPGHNSLHRADDLVVAHGFGSRLLSVSADGGETWVSAVSGLDDMFLYDVTHDGAGYLYVAATTGVYRTTTPVVATDPRLAPFGVSLARVRPTPTPGAAVIAFELSSGSDVRLEIFDAVGRRVATVAEGPRHAGRHLAEVDASALSPGVYTVLLRAGSGVARIPLVRQ